MSVKGNLSGSEHYIWSRDDILGKGATGHVLRCRNKHNGKVFAVKTFSSQACARIPGLQTREIEVLRKLQHENIVKVIDVEQELQSQNRVIIMELCHGSVHHMLEEPHNSYGVCESVFIQILKDVAIGMTYLNAMRIVHRDIKPGNILRVIQDGGQSIFKLSDFGAARELTDGEENFYSLHGTEEYLDPGIFRQAVLGHGRGQHFNASVDLWSLGVTIYHIATGSLPFRPYHGRNGNKQTMFTLTARKDSGVISGVEESEGGLISWSKELPNTSPLSQGLKLIVTPVISGLLETTSELKWDFDSFFREAEHVWTKMAFHVFYTFECASLVVYVDKTSSLATLQELIAQQTSVPAATQLIFYDHRILKDFIKGLQSAESFPKTSAEKPYFLFHNCDFGDARILEPLVIPKFPKFGTTLSLDNDATLAKTCASILCLVARNVEYYGLQQKLLMEAVQIFVWFVHDLVVRMNILMEQTQLHVEQLDKDSKYFTQRKEDMLRMLTFTAREKSTQADDFLVLIQSLTADVIQNVMEVNRTMQGQRNHVAEFFERVVKKNELLRNWKGDLGCHDPTLCLRSVQAIVASVCETSKTFRQKKKHGRLSYNEEQIHKVEKNTLNTDCSKAVSLCQDDCYKHLSSMHQQFTSTAIGSRLQGWFSFAVQVKMRTERLSSKINRLSDRQIALSAHLDEAHCAFSEHFNKCMTQLEDSNPMAGNGATFCGNHLGEVHNSELANYKVSTGDSVPLPGKDHSIQQQLYDSIEQLNVLTKEVKNNVKMNERHIGKNGFSKRGDSGYHTNGRSCGQEIQNGGHDHGRQHQVMENKQVD